MTAPADTPVLHGYTLRDLDRMAWHAAITGHAGTPGPELHDTAWEGIAEALCTAAGRPAAIALMRAGRRALQRDIEARQSDHGTRRGPRRTGRRFAAYWTPTPGAAPDDTVTDIIALRQVWEQLAAWHRRDLAALADADGDRAAAAAALGVSLHAYGIRLSRARAAARAAWHDGEADPGLWRRDTAAPMTKAP